MSHYSNETDLNTYYQRLKRNKACGVDREIVASHGEHLEAQGYRRFNGECFIEEPCAGKPQARFCGGRYNDGILIIVRRVMVVPSTRQLAIGHWSLAGHRSLSLPPGRSWPTREDYKTGPLQCLEMARRGEMNASKRIYLECLR